MSNHLLELRDLKTYFPVARSLWSSGPPACVKAVDGVNLTLGQAEVLGLVGESGCGKSTLARAIVQLAPVTGGEILFEGRNLAGLSASALRKTRTRMQMVFQDPYASLNPRMTVFDAIAEPLRVHGITTRAQTPARVTELMNMVGLAPRFMRKYPHEFSGGQRQRIAIARALSVQPKLIIADEPVSALDVSVQAQILNLIADLCRKAELAMIFISHDLAVVKHLAHRIAVMYLGRIVEMGETERVLNNPLHPYTQMLLQAAPVPDPRRRLSRGLVKGEAPSSLHPPEGCAFHPRCPIADDSCGRVTPELRNMGEERQAACIKLDSPSNVKKASCGTQ